MNLFVIISASALAGALIAWAITHFAAKARIIEKESELRELKSLRELERANSELRGNQMSEAFKKQAEQTLRGLTSDLNKDIREMKNAFEQQKNTSIRESSEIKTKFEETVKHLKDQTESIGSQAADLANALKGKNKMQGIFGETVLENILRNEGLTNGRDYDSEFWLRDKKGNIIQNDETGKRMRPDFALHFPDSTDILIDAKVSLTALSDYFSAEDEAGKEDAAKRNLQSVMDHISELTSKEYQKFVEGRKTLDYVIMFIPNYGAYQLAKQKDPDIFSKAFSKNVLITTEETLIPFLRLIRTAWVQKDQLENMHKIVSGAQEMVNRVAIFAQKNEVLGEKLKQALNEYDENTKRLVEGRQSIVKAARNVMDCGIEITNGRSLPSADENQ